MKNSKKRDRSLYGLLIKNYVIFTLALVALMLLIYLVEVGIEESIIKSPRTDGRLGGQEELLAGDYEKLSMRELLGTYGYFEVLDGNRRVIYSQQGSGDENYTERELSYIQPYGAEYLYTMTDYETEEGERQILVTRKREEWDTGYQVNESYMVLNQELQVIASNIPWQAEQFTERELAFLTTHENALYHIYKYEYTAGDGENYTLILHVKKMDRQRYKKLSNVWRIFVPVYGVVFLLVIICFTFLIHRRVKEPLDLLNEGILDFTRGRNTQISYKGPKEFESIFNNFNVMAEKLRESEKTREHLLAEKQRMLADISHDLKTPITVIRGYARAVNDGLVDKASEKKYLEIILQKTESLTEMINTFYDYGKLEHPEFRLVRKNQDLAEFLREYLADKYDEITLMGLELEAEIPEGEISYSFDEVQLRRVFDNIISNSLKHNQKGTIIYVTLQQTERNIRIEIGDNGSGIPAELQDNLFEPFTVGDDSRHNRQGSGLGLAVARKIVELHGGALFLEKAGNPAISTLFVIRLLK